MDGKRLTFRLNGDLFDVLEELARRARLDRSTTLRELIRQAGARNELWPPPALTELEVVALLAEKARGGSVTATVVLLRRLQREPPPRDGVSELDELDAVTWDQTDKDKDR
jgi:predicted transcriptional regulator